MARFDAQVGAHVAKYKKRLLAVLRQSAQDVFSLAQTPQPSVKVTGGSFELGKIPVDTGFLRNSFVSAVNGIEVSRGPDSYILAIANAEIGDSIFGGWTAVYAPVVNYGGPYQGRLFATMAAQQWQSIVSSNAERFRSAS